MLKVLPDVLLSFMRKESAVIVNRSKLILPGRWDFKKIQLDSLSK